MAAQAVTFTGSNYLQAPRHQSINGIVDELTLLGWIYCKRYGDQRIFCLSAAGADSVGFGLDTHGSTLRFLGSEGIGINCKSGGSIPLEQWVHVACVFSRSRKIFELFVNSVCALSIPIDQSLIPSQFPLTIGMSPVGSPYSGAFVGQMCHLSVWHIALFAHEIRKFQTVPPLGYEGVVAYWPLLHNTLNYATGKASTDLALTTCGSTTTSFLQMESFLGDAPVIQWTPITHRLFSVVVRDMVRTMLLVNVRLEYLLPSDILLLILEQAVAMSR
eukprot:TRINITY_DN14047_c0_g1_i1.p1 TRINITY_DN14047_c0_g1~~TRINITY_DN14047_c0_g1_i1.p1  ORF type:complete len:274 (-),score=46.06 TRINITY_DN14047_c0_g1_i1:142-963(-)